jgi:hypothetical protein
LAPLSCKINQFEIAHERPQISGVRHIPPGQAGIPALFDFPLECAAKVESAVARCACPQSGQAIGSPSRRTSFSNLVPQSSQTYSKIGILTISRPWQLVFILAQRGGRCWGGEGPILKVLANLVAYPAKDSQSLRFSAREACGIIERVMNRDGSRKIWAAFLRVIANCEDVVEGLALKLVNMLGAMAGDVDAKFSHDCDRLRTNVAWFCSGAGDFESVAGVVAQETFRHLASSGVSRAKNQDSFFMGHYCHQA